MSVFQCFFLLGQTADQCEEGSSPLYGRPKKRCSSQLQEQQKTLRSIASKTLLHTAKAQNTASMSVSLFMCIHLQCSTSFTLLHLSLHFICKLLFVAKVKETTVTTQQTTHKSYSVQSPNVTWQGHFKSPHLFPNTDLPDRPFTKLMYYILQTGGESKGEGLWHKVMKQLKGLYVQVSKLFPNCETCR